MSKQQGVCRIACVWDGVLSEEGHFSFFLNNSDLTFGRMQSWFLLFSLPRTGPSLGWLGSYFTQQHGRCAVLHLGLLLWDLQWVNLWLVRTSPPWPEPQEADAAALRRPDWQPLCERYYLKDVHSGPPGGRRETWGQSGWLSSDVLGSTMSSGPLEVSDAWIKRMWSLLKSGKCYGFLTAVPNACLLFQI